MLNLAVRYLLNSLCNMFTAGWVFPAQPHLTRFCTLLWSSSRHCLQDGCFAVCTQSSGWPSQSCIVLCIWTRIEGRASGSESKLAERTAASALTGCTIAVNEIPKYRSDAGPLNT